MKATGQGSSSLDKPEKTDKAVVQEKKRLQLKLASKLGNIKEETKTQSRTLPQKTKCKRANN